MRIAMGQLWQETNTFNPIDRVPRPIWPWDEMMEWKPSD